MSGSAAQTSSAVMADAQLTIAKPYKPFEGFEKKYQGVSATTPIAIPCAVDQRAGTPGFDPNLLEGIPMPEGARVLLWIPMCFISDPQSIDPFRFYSYTLIWRFNNLGDYRAPPSRHRVGGSRRRPYHLARQSPGASDSTFATPAPRVTLPASWHVVAYEQAEPVAGPGESALRVEKITPTIDTLVELIQPLTPSGAPGVIQQGVFDPATSGGAQMPVFVPFWLDAEGDELFMLVTRQNPTGTWDFTDPALDLAFSNVYGTGDGAHEVFRDVGIYVQTGTNP